MFPTRETCNAAASAPIYELCQMSAPTQSAIAELLKNLSPAPETSLGERLNAGKRSVRTSRSRKSLISMPSAPRVMTRFWARAFVMSLLFRLEHVAAKRTPRFDHVRHFI